MLCQSSVTFRFLLLLFSFTVIVRTLSFSVLCRPWTLQPYAFQPWRLFLCLRVPVSLGAAFYVFRCLSLLLCFFCIASVFEISFLPSPPSGFSLHVLTKTLVVTPACLWTNKSINTTCSACPVCNWMERLVSSYFWHINNDLALK